MTFQPQFVDLTLRDGQQSISATRMTTDQALQVLPLVEEAGYSAIELWGGAVLDSCVRYLDEDPWERLDRFHEAVSGTGRIRILCRGQNLFAYQPFPDDLVIAFVREAIRSGTGTVRVFDALNDWRNLQIPVLATKAYGGIAEAALSYTTSPVHTTAYFIDLARKAEEEGADQIAIKDMAGLLLPAEAATLFRALKQSVAVPLVFHSHTTTGVATLNAVLAMTEGIQFIDTAITPFAGGSSHPPIEILLAFAEALGIAHGMDVKRLEQAQVKLFDLYRMLRTHIPDYGYPGRVIRLKDIDPQAVRPIARLIERGRPEDLAAALPQMRDLMLSLNYPPHNDEIFQAQIPGGMLSNLRSQLKAMGQLGRLDEILAEVPIVRADVGYVPLVTPTSQIVGSQATFNVLVGRYEFVSNEFRMLLRGDFGRTPAPPNPEIVQKVISGEDTPHPYRPGAYLLPVLEDPCDLPYIRTQRDLLLHHMLKQPADDFLKRRYGVTA